MGSAILLAGQSLVSAYLEILRPTVPDPVIPLKFNPTEYQIQKSNTFAEIAIPGLESPPIQFVRGAAEKLTMEVLVDTSDTLKDVRTAYVDKLRGLLNIDRELHAPPIIAFTWDKQIFKGVLESLNVTYVLFTPHGVPLRAKLSIGLKEYRPVAVQVKETPRNSPDVEKSYVVQRGDTLSSIAFALFADNSKWRNIAQHNGIKDPRALQPGWVLQIPRVVNGA